MQEEDLAQTYCETTGSPIEDKGCIPLKNMNTEHWNTQSTSASAEPSLGAISNGAEVPRLILLQSPLGDTNVSNLSTFSSENGTNPPVAMLVLTTTQMPECATSKEVQQSKVDCLLKAHPASSNEQGLNKGAGFNMLGTTGSQLLAQGCAKSTPSSSGPSAQSTSQSSTEENQKMFVCNIDNCGHKFLHAAMFRYHQMSHKKRTPRKSQLACSYEGCDRKFLWPTHLKYHMLTHRQDRAYKCQESNCGMAFLTPQRLNVHRRIHTGERPFQCKEPGCGKSFTTNGNLANHTRIHSGEKPFACEECGRKFAEKSSLKKHTIKHTGKKPFACKFCGQEFTQSGSRSVHMKKNHLQELTSKKIQGKEPIGHEQQNYRLQQQEKPKQQQHQKQQIQTVTSTLRSQFSDIVLMSGQNAAAASTAAVGTQIQPQQLILHSLGDRVVLYQQLPKAAPVNPQPSPAPQVERPLCEYQEVGIGDGAQADQDYLNLEQCILGAEEVLTNDDSQVAVSPASSVEDNVVVLTQPTNIGSLTKMYHGNEPVQDIVDMTTSYHDNPDRATETSVYDETDLLSTELEADAMSPSDS